MALDLGTLTGYLKLEGSGFTGPLKAAAAGMEGFKATALLATAGVATGAITAGVALYKIGSVFDELSDTIRAATGKTGDDLKGLVDSAKNVGREVPASFDEIGPVIASLNKSLGVTGPVLEKLAGQFLEYSRISKDSLDPKAVSETFNAFKVSGKDASGTLDQLFRISQDTNVPLSSLISSVQQGGANFRTFGLGVAESASLVGHLEKAGINGGRVVAGMSRAAVQFAKDGVPMRKGLEDTITSIKGYLKTGNTAAATDLAAKIFSTRGAPQFVDAIKSGALSVDSLSKVTTKSSDTIMKAGKDTADFAEQWQLFKNNAMLAVEPIAKRVFAAVGQGMAWINAVGVPALASLGAKFQAFGAVVQAIWARFTTGTDGAGSKFAQFQAIVVSIWASIQVIFTTAITVITALWNAFGSTLVSFISTNLSAAIAVIQGVFTIIQGIFQVFAAILTGNWSGVWTGLKNIMSGVWTVIVGVITQVWNIIRAIFSVAGIALRAQAAAVWNGIKAVISSAMSGIRSAVSAGWNTVKSATSAAMSAIRSAVSGAWNAVKSATSAAFGSIRGLVSSGMSAMRSAVSSGIATVVKFFSGLIGKIKGALGGARSALIGVGGDIVRGLISGISSLAGAVTQALLDLLPGPLKKFAGKLGITSPSKVFAEFGKFVGQGFIQGIVGTRSEVAATMTKLADLVAKTHHAGVMALVKSARHDLLGLASDYEATVAKVAAAVDKLKGLQDAAAQLKASVTSQVISTGDFTGQEDTSFGAIITSLTAAKDQASQFATVMAQLAKAGLDQTTISQLIAAGPASLAAAQAILASGQTGITQINALQAGIASAAKALGTTAANDLYASGIKSAQGLVKGLKAQETAIGNQMERIAKIMVDKLEKKLGIHSPSRVFAGLGDNIGQGLVVGVDRQRSNVGASVGRLVSAATPGGVNVGAIGSVGPGGSPFDGLLEEVRGLRSDNAALQAAVREAKDFTITDGGHMANNFQGQVTARTNRMVQR